MKTIEIKSIIKAKGQFSHILEIYRTGKRFKYPVGGDVALHPYSEAQASRVMFLAYAYLRGKAYRVTEPTADLTSGHVHLSWMVWALLFHHGVEVTQDQIDSWFKEPETEARKERRIRRMAAGEEARRLKREANLSKLASIRASKVA